MKAAGQKSYEAYRDHTGGVSLASGHPIPEWPTLPPAIQRAWAAAEFTIKSPLLEAISDEIEQLEMWAKESKTGGWSTHQVDPMRRRADQLRQVLAGN